MESLVELCDLIVQNPAQFQGKIAWICSRCPTAESLLIGSPRVSRSQLHAILGIARFLSKCPDSEHEMPKSLLLAFYSSIPASFNLNFWPQAFSTDAISSFFNDFLYYISKAAELSSAFATDVAGFTGDIVVQTINDIESIVSRIFFHALCSNFPPILPSDSNKLICVLLDRFEIPLSSSGEAISTMPDAASAQSSPLGMNHYQSPNVEASLVSMESSSSTTLRDDASSFSGIVVNGVGRIAWKRNGDLFSGNTGFSDGGEGGIVGYKKVETMFEDIPVESLEKKEEVFKLIGHILNKVAIDPQIMEQVREITKDQLQSMLVFLKKRKRDWPEQASFPVSFKRSVTYFCWDMKIPCFE